MVENSFFIAIVIEVCELFLVLTKFGVHFGKNIIQSLAGQNGFFVCRVAVVFHERSGHGVDFGLGVVDGFNDTGVQIGVDFLHVSVQGKVFALGTFNAAVVGVFNACNIVKEILNGLLAVWGFYVVDILAIIRFPDFGSAHLVGYGLATVHNGHKSLNSADVGAASGAGFLQILAITEISAIDSGVQFQLFCTAKFLSGKSNRRSCNGMLDFVFLP